MIGEEVIAVYGDAGDGKELFEVQKLVRCKECKHNVGLTNGFWEEDIVCDYWESDGLTADDFCSYGERKESE